MQVLGLICGVILSLCILVSLICMLMEQIDIFRNNSNYHARELGRRDIGISLIQNAHWFSESKDVYEAIVCLGNEISANSYCNAQQARNRWYEKTGRK